LLETVSTWPAWYLAVIVGYGVFLGGIAVYDARTRRIPNVAVYPAIAAAALLAFVQPGGPWWTFWAAGLGAWLFFVVLAALTGGGIGYGDSKLALLIGLMSGWPGVLVAFSVAFPIAAAVSLALMAAGRIGRKDYVPFGPALALGALVAVVAGRQLAALVWPAFATAH
jgi:prepilin signal peptidase PulO-like enzyme (type II secretory pathway)